MTSTPPTPTSAIHPYAEWTTKKPPVAHSYTSDVVILGPGRPSSSTTWVSRAEIGGHPQPRPPVLDLGAFEHLTPTGVKDDVHDQVPGQREQQRRSLRHSLVPLRSTHCMILADPARRRTTIPMGNPAAGTVSASCFCSCSR